MIPGAKAPARVACALHRVRDVLDDPQRWTRGALARNLFKEAVLPLSEQALSWSLTGAVAAALLEVLGARSGQIEWQRLYDATFAALWRALPADHPRSARIATDLDGFNDFVGTDHHDILALVDRAIATVEAA